MQIVERQAALVDIGADLQRLLRADVGDDIDRVELGDLGERGLLAAAAHQVVRIDEVLAHLSVEGRGHQGVAEVQLGERDLRLGRQNVRLGRLLFEHPVVDVDLRGRVLPEERSVSPDLQVRVVARRLGRLELRLSLLELVLVLVLLDGEQEVVLLDELAVLKMDLFQIAWHAGDELHRVDRLGVAGDDQGLADRLDFRQDDGDRRPGGLGRRRLHGRRGLGLVGGRSGRRGRGRRGARRRRRCRRRARARSACGGSARRRRLLCRLRRVGLAAPPNVAPQLFEFVRRAGRPRPSRARQGGDQCDGDEAGLRRSR